MNSITTEEYLNFLKYHQITHLKTIELLTNDLLIRDYDIRLKRVFEYCQMTSNWPVNSNDFRDWQYHDILEWIKKTK